MVHKKKREWIYCFCFVAEIKLKKMERVDCLYLGAHIKLKMEGVYYYYYKMLSCKVEKFQNI